MILGNVIKQTRIQQGKTIKDIAEEARITISLLSQIENNKANPSINSLMAIAKALNTPISDFFDDHEIVTSPVVKSYKRRPIQTQKGVTFYLLSPTRKDLSIEFKYNVYEKGGTNGHFHTHQGEECGIVLEGRLEVIYDGDAYTLEAGDSIYIDSTKPHTMKNVYDGRTIAIWVDSPPPSETYI
ncbi:MAG: cupin domain-containing protein [Desulfobacteraceae bacterium]|jgi:transcriptional regulator with XRE-family HTH domain